MFLCRCSDKEKEKVPPPFPSCSPGRKGPGPVDFIHVNSGRIELHPTQFETARHSWCGPHMQILEPPKDSHPKDKEQGRELKDLAARIGDLERLIRKQVESSSTAGVEGLVRELKEEFQEGQARQEKLVGDLEALHARIHTLETHNKALANIILPTLVRSKMPKYLYLY